MSEQVMAEITRTRRVIVYADVQKVAEQNATDRARFDGTDFEFAQDWIKTEAWDFLDDTRDDDGFRVEEDYDDVDVDAYKEPPA